MIRDILIHPNKQLRVMSKSIPVKEIKSKEMSAFLIDMEETMLEKDGIGLAAPQVGVQKRVIVVNTKDGVVSLINPKITKSSWRKESEEEGCLSVPGVYGYVKRSVRISVEAYGSKGEKITFEARGLFARVIQHEVDHLDGVLFIDKAKKSRKINVSEE